MEHNRKMEIIRILLHKNDYTTISRLAVLLQVSSKTVRNDLAGVSAFLLENGLTLIKKTGVGIYIDATKEQKLSAANLLMEKDQSADYSPQARKIYIGLRLINCVDNCRIYELSKELFVSRATIHKDITSLADCLPEYGLSLIRKNNNGVQIHGKERSLRDLMVHLMQEDKGYTDFKGLIQQKDYVCKDSFIFTSLDYTDRDILSFVQSILQSGNTFINTLPFRSLLTVLLRTFVCLIRLIEEHPITLSPEFMQELAAEPLYPESVQLAELLASHYQVSFHEEEIRYLQIHFISVQNTPGITLKEKEESAQLAWDLLLYWENTFHRPFTGDQELFEALTSHLGPTINRFRHGIRIENPMMHDIRTYYKNTFLITKESMRSVEERYHCRLSDDEVGYIAIHLAAALDRMKVPLRTILVAHCGTGAGNLLVRKLATHIPEISITSCESFISIQNRNLSDTDLIISTLELKLSDQVPVLLIKPLLYDHDILRLKEIIKTHYNRKNSPLPNVE